MTREEFIREYWSERVWGMTKEEQHAMFDEAPDGFYTYMFYQTPNNVLRAAGFPCHRKKSGARKDRLNGLPVQLVFDYNVHMIRVMMPNYIREIDGKAIDRYRRATYFTEDD